MTILTVDEIIKIHSLLCRKTGGSDGLRDRGLLESAVFSADMTFGEAEIYPTIEEKCARLCYALTSNHPFVDGNKRIGILVMLTSLRLNGVELKFTQKELIDLSLSLASGKLSYEDILNWVKVHNITSISGT
ncbi:MAG: type II toxin-antitoxin system death-on-curing family toxin [Oscillospiraceae bacterium]|nr:type II toxin-antitoxin system death-on-curing family toxin [Oscillospiraceae bacterium]